MLDPRESTVSRDASRPILVDARWLDSGGPRNVRGLARVAQEIARRLPQLERLEPRLPLLHPAETIWLTALLARRRPSVFYSPGFNAPPTCPVPFVLTVYDLIHLEVPEESSRAKRLYYRLHVRPAVRRARAVLTGSDYSRARIVEWSGVDADRVVVVRGAAGAEFTPDGDRHEPGYPYLLYVGNHKPHKNLSRLVRALAELRDGSSLRLVLVGPVERELLEVAGSVAVADRLVFLGDVPDERLPALYRGANAFVFPSLHEGFGLPPLEAMACGTPVVSSLATSLAEVVGDAAVAVDPLDVGSIAAGIDGIVGDEQLRRQLRARGLARAASFSWDETARRTLQALVGGRAREVETLVRRPPDR
jgi:glycosyltransferase involved in cell wall biosynthesis